MALRPFEAWLSVCEGGYRWDDSVQRIGGWSFPEPVGPWLVPVAADLSGNPRREYAPFDYVDLHRRFARAGRSRRALLRLANQYGFLSATPRPVGPDTETDPIALGEPFELWASRIAELKQLVDLWDLVKFEDAGTLSTYVHWAGDARRVSVGIVSNGAGLDREATHLAWSSWDPTKPLNSTCKLEAGDLEMHTVGTLAHADSPDGRLLMEHWSPGDLLGPMRYYIFSQVNATVQTSVSPIVSPFRDGGVSYVPDSLLAALYMHFALELAGQRRPPAICMECGAAFHPTHGSQKYCEPACRKRAHRQRSFVEAGDRCASVAQVTGRRCRIRPGPGRRFCHLHGPG